MHRRSPNCFIVTCPPLAGKQAIDGFDGKAISDYTCRRSSYHGIRFYVTRNDGSHADNSTCTNLNALADNGTFTNPNIVTKYGTSRIRAYVL